MKVSASTLSRRHLASYILGTHELELRQVLSRIIARCYRTILIIGAADGYYPVGLALRSQTARIEAFEARPEFHSLIRRAARRNRVSDRIRLNGKCNANTLLYRLETAALPALILTDAESGDTDLLDLRSVPKLRRADILVETKCLTPYGTDALIDHFWRTHNVECYTAQCRVLADFPPAFLSIFQRWFPRLAVELMDEQRVGLPGWVLLTAKSEVRNSRFERGDAMLVEERKFE